MGRGMFSGSQPGPAIAFFSEMRREVCRRQLSLLFNQRMGRSPRQKTDGDSRQTDAKRTLRTATSALRLPGKQPGEVAA